MPQAWCLSNYKGGSGQSEQVPALPVRLISS